LDCSADPNDLPNCKIPMLQYFSTIDYGFSGGTFTVLNIFKNVQVTSNSILFKETKIEDERPDQFANRIYTTSDYYWAVFLANGIRNPLVQWGGTDSQFNINLQKKYDGLVYQFGNISKYNPPHSTTPPYTDERYKEYEGTDLNRSGFERIKPGQMIIFETGNGQYGLRAFGAGQIPIKSVSHQPHHRQSVIPITTGITGITQISCGSFNTAVLTDTGQIYYWGGNTGSVFTSQSFDVYGLGYFATSLAGCKYIDSTNSGILAIKSDGGITCFGSCTTFNSLYSGTTGFTKVAFNEGFTAGVAIESNGTPTYFGSLTIPSGISFYTIDCGQQDCIGINRTTNYGVTGWGPNKTSLFTGYNQGITGITAIALGYDHFLALKDNGVIYGGGATADGQLNIPTGVAFSKISAGRYHSAALTTDGKLMVWGKIAKTYQNTSPVITLEKVTPTTISGSFSQLDSGAEHIVVKETGENKRYIGVVDTIDTVFKRISVKAYNYPGTIPTLLGQTAELEPASTRISVWDYDANNNPIETYNIQNQLLSVQYYYDSTKQIIQGGNVLDPAENSNWKDVYLAGYTNADNNEFLTVKKDATEEKRYEDSQIKIINESNVQIIKNTLSAQLPLKNQIKIIL